MTRNEQQVPQFPGIGATIRAGLDLTTRCWWLLILPVTLDLWLWLGPQLGVGQLMQASMAQLEALVGSMNALDPTLQTTLVESAESINMMGQLAVPLLGIPVLLGTRRMPAPLEQTVWSVADPGAFLLLFLGLALTGLILGGVYFSLITQAVTVEPQWGTPFLRQVTQNVGRIILLGLAFLAIMIAFYIPLALLAVVGSLFQPLIGAFILLAGLTLLMWVLVYLSFSLHAVFIGRMPVLRSLLYSVRFIQAFLPTAFTLLLIIIFTLGGVRWLWGRVADGSWLNLVSIFGHAFISTALISATFLYFRDREPFFNQYLSAALPGRFRPPAP